MPSSRLVPVVLALVALSGSLSAQTHHGSIRGRVLDPSGAPVPNAGVRLVHDETLDARLIESGPTGEYVATSLAAGIYRLELELDGYKRQTQEIVLHVNQSLRVDVRLALGARTEEIVVSAPVVPIRRETPALGAVIENRQVMDLPLDGRNFLDLSLLVPGTVPSAQGSAASVRGEFAFNVNGAREDANSFLLDGVENNDPKLNTFAVRPPVDAIREFEVLTSAHDASFGRHAGAQVNVILKSGTNRLSGTAWEFFRDGRFDARNAFAPADEPAPEYRRHQFGGSLGGPIVSTRAFFFADYEGLRLREGITRITNVPTAAERAGDFSQSAFSAPVDPFTGQPFPGAVIPVERRHPVGGAIAALYPLPNRDVPFRNFVSSPVQTDRNDHFDVRVDLVADGSGLMARYSFSDRDLYEPFSGATFAAVPGFGTDVPRRAQHLAVGDTRILSPRFVNELRAGFVRVSAGSFHENRGRSLNREVGLPEVSDNPRDFGLSFITISGFSPLGDEFNNPQHSTTNTFQVLDTLTWSSGRHLAKIGGGVRLLRQDAYRDVQSRGFLTFSDQVPITGNALADLLIGLPVVTGAARLDNPQRLRSWSWNAFVHDSIWLRPDLTLSAGLRYEYHAPPVDADDRANVYDPVTRSLVPVGTGGMPRGGFEADRNNLAPRLGLAWAPGEGETVVRGGYGLYYDQSALAPGEGLYFNPPFFDFGLFFPLPGLPLTLSDPFPSLFPVPVPPSALAFQRDLRTAFLHHWNVGVQRQLGGSRAVEVGYAGSRGVGLIAARDINQPAPSPVRPNLRPDPRFDDITLIESRARSRYDSLQVSLQQRLDRGLSMLAAYTLGRSRDDASGFFASAGDANFPQDSRNPRLEWGRSNFDVRHRLSVGFTWELPFGSGRRWLDDGGALAAVFGGWQVSGILTAQSGRPFTVALPPELDHSNTGRSILGFGANDRPDLVGDPAVPQPTAERWFDTSAFEFPEFGAFGDSGRNILDGPGYRNVNLSLARRVALGGTATLQLRAEAFNLFNRVNLDLPDIFLGSPTFGQIRSARAPRRIQFGARVGF